MMPTGISDEDSMPNFDESLNAPRDASLPFRVGLAWQAPLLSNPRLEREGEDRSQWTDYAGWELAKE